MSKCTDITDTCKTEVSKNAKNHFNQNYKKWSGECKKKPESKQDCDKCTEKINSFIDDKGYCNEETTIDQVINAFLQQETQREGDPQCFDCVGEIINENKFRQMCKK